MQGTRQVGIFPDRDPYENYNTPSTLGNRPSENMGQKLDLLILGIVLEMFRCPLTVLSAMIGFKGSKLP